MYPPGGRWRLASSVRKVDCGMAFCHLQSYSRLDYVWYRVPGPICYHWYHFGMGSRLDQASMFPDLTSVGVGVRADRFVGAISTPSPIPSIVGSVSLRGATQDPYPLCYLGWIYLQHFRLAIPSRLHSLVLVTACFPLSSL